MFLKWRKGTEILTYTYWRKQQRLKPYEMQGKYWNNIDVYYVHTKYFYISTIFFFSILIRMKNLECLA